MTNDPRDLISDSYRELNRQLHEQNGKYGVMRDTGDMNEADAVTASIIDVARNNKMKSILDYGCGKGMFKQAASRLAPDLTVTEYDPAIPGKDALPEPADLVLCLDVLEHIEPALLDAVLRHIRSVTIKGALLRPSLVPALKTLQDGRNAHLIVEAPGWWQGKVSRYFNVISTQSRLDKLNRLAAIDLVCTPKPT